MPARGSTLPRNWRVVWSRLDSGTVAVATRGTTAGLGTIARLAEVPLEFGYLRNGCPSQWPSARIVVGRPGVGARHVLRASPVV